MKLDTNFRAEVNKRSSWLTTAFTALTIGMLLMSVGLLVNLNTQLSRANETEVVVISMMKEKKELISTLDMLESHRDPDSEGVADWLDTIAPYYGRSPEYLLFELEKNLPKKVHLISVDYDRRSGVATINAVSQTQEYISQLMAKLEQGGNFKEVLLVNQSEYGQEGHSKFLLKLKEKHGEKGGE